MNTNDILMKKQWHRVCAVFMAFLLFGGTLPAYPAQANTPKVLAEKRPVPVKRQSLAELSRSTPRKTYLPANPTDQEIFSFIIATEPLVPMTDSVNAAENESLAKALVPFANRSNFEDFSTLTDFLAKHPNSRWAAALQMVLGQFSFDSGYLSNALKYWSLAWENSKNETKAERKSVADFSVSNLVLMEARLGLTESLQKHLTEIKHRALTGSVEQRVNAASSGLWTMQNHCEVAYKCGPYAISALSLLDKNADKGKCSKIIKSAFSTKQGTNLSQINEWSKQMGLKFQMAKRTVGAAIITPSVMHWNFGTSGHFATLMSRDKDGYYEVHDATFDTKGNLRISEQALATETDGYFLIPDGPLPPGWRAVDENEGRKVWGKGAAQKRDDTKTASTPIFCPMCYALAHGLAGMATASAFGLNATLTIVDYPLQENPPVGPSTTISCTYNYLESLQPSSWIFSNLGADWNINFVSYLTDDGSNTTVHVQGGGYELYSDSGYSTPNLTSQATLAYNSSGSGSFQRIMPDGSIENFTLNTGTGRTGGYWLMTSVVDPQSNYVTINWDMINFRVNSITDMSGNTSTFAYVSNTIGNAGYYKIASITDAFGRSASFAYDQSSGLLISITDAAGNTSQFFYDSTSNFVHMMVTPYGATSFYQYQPQGGSTTFLPVGLKFTYPDGSTAVIENWLDEQKATYYWDREATAIAPNDPANHNYSNCRSMKFMELAVTPGFAMPVINWSREPLEAPVFNYYDGEFGYDRLPTSGTPATNKPIHVMQQRSGFRTTGTVAMKPGVINPTPGDQVVINLDDGFMVTSTPPPILYPNYIVKSGDQLSDIAKGLADAVNSNTYCQYFGITAQAVPMSPTFILTSYSVDIQSYAQILATGVNETVSFAPGPNVAQRLLLSGTIIAGDLVKVSVTDSNLMPLTGSSTETVSYQVQANDTYNSILQALSCAFNADSNLEAIGVTSSWSNAGFSTVASPRFTAPLFYLQSQSSSTTTYSTSSSVFQSSGVISQSALPYGIVQDWDFTYNSQYFVTQSTDPIGRQFNFAYAGNNIDLTDITEAQTGSILGHWDYSDPSSPHCPTAFTDGSGQKSTSTYNGFKEPSVVTDALGEATTLSYDSNGYLTQIDGPLSGSNDITTFAFYGYGALHTITDSEGYTLTFAYDGLNRPLSTTYPDGTSAQTIYDRLDAVMHCDRIGRWSQASYDSQDQLVFSIDPLGRKTSYCWCTCGSIASITDAANNTTTWQHDLEGRLQKKTFADGKSMTFAYDKATGNLISQTDALTSPQTTFFSYNIDDTDQSTSYGNAANTTTSVSRIYDNIFPRTTTISNGWGQYSYTFNPYITALTDRAFIWIGGTPQSGDTINATIANSSIGTFTLSTFTVPSGDVGSPSKVAIDLASALNTGLSGSGITANSTGSMVTINATTTSNPVTVTSVSASGSTTATIGGGGRLSEIDTALNPSGTYPPITYSFDALGRTVCKMINGSQNKTSRTFDAIGRLTSQVNAMGTFGYTYVDDTGSSKGCYRLKSVSYPNSQSTNFTWLPNIGDQRLQQIANLNSSSAVLSQFSYAYNPAGEITQWLQVQTPGGTTTKKRYSLGYDLASQLITANSDVATSTNATIGGAVHAGDIVSITAYDGSLTGTTPPGQETASYQVLSTDTASSIASSLVHNSSSTGINDIMSTNLGITATATGAAISISQSGSSTYSTLFTSAVTGSAVTDTISLSAPSFHTQQYYKYDCAGNRAGLQGDSTGTLATGLSTNVTAYSNNNLNQVTGTAAGGPIRFQGTTTNPIQAAAVNVGETLTITASTIGNNDVLTLYAQDSTFNQQQSAAYTINTTVDTSTNLIASHFAAQITSALSTAGISATSSANVVTIVSTTGHATSYIAGVSPGALETLVLGSGTNGSAANITPSTAFTAAPTLAGNTSATPNSVIASAISGGGVRGTAPSSLPPYTITVNGETPQTFSYDLNGNTNNTTAGTYPQFAYDAENRLVKIVYDNTGSNYTTLTYDAMGRCVTLVETGTTPSYSGNAIKQFVYCDSAKCEELDSSGQLTTSGKQFFELGQINFASTVGTSNFYELNHRGDVVGVDTTSQISAFSFDPYGIASNLSGSFSPDFGFTGLYELGRSGLNHALFRAYNPSLGRWLSRDPIGENGGLNLYGYVGNNPISNIDPLGLLRLQAGIDDPPSWVSEKPAKSDSSWEIALVAAPFEAPILGAAGELLGPLTAILPKLNLVQRSCSGMAKMGGRGLPKTLQDMLKGARSPEEFQKIYEAIMRYQDRLAKIKSEYNFIKKAFKEAGQDIPQVAKNDLDRDIGATQAELDQTLRQIRETDK